jgi:hypothetical protein
MAPGEPGQSGPRVPKLVMAALDEGPGCATTLGPHVRATHALVLMRRRRRATWKTAPVSVLMNVPPNLVTVEASFSGFISN